ncbi:hypothetical protein CSAL01_06815 [Colletotrichum salicis]|uniref:Uncharacterized protein n=1 Tax=Colletotrichum salicis TaxID=1209931 RepID=A0A135V144_9PEZI|nr:hypothetical protein CSAL01_06815 [Colletotrichum salicis]
MESFPLQSVTRPQLRRLGEALWDWTPCVDDENIRSTPAFPPDEVQSLRSHDDQHNLIVLIKSNTEIQRVQLTTEYFTGRHVGRNTVPEDEKLAFNLAIKAMLMISCSHEEPAGEIDPCVWRKNQTARELVSIAFARGHPSLDEPNDDLSNIKPALKATRLRKVARLSFKGTDDLRHHLRMDSNTGVVEIFHHTAFLKECLKASKAAKVEPILPRQLALETLDSIQNVLFHPDEDSRDLLRSLVSKAAFDPDCLVLGDRPYFREEDKVPLLALSTHGLT